MNKKTKNLIKYILIYTAVLLLLVWTIAPVVWMFISSITPKLELLVDDPLAMPDNITFERYIEIFSAFEKALFGGRISTSAEVFLNGLFNSIFVTVSTTVLALFFGGLAAYAFSRLKFKGKSPLLLAILFVQLLPSVTLIIPLYKIVQSLGMIDNLYTLIIVNLSAVIAYVVWVLNGYYSTIPPDLESAARIDGCSYFQAFLRIVFPLAKPGFVAVGALSFLMCWDEFLYALVFTNSQTSKTVTVALSEFSTKSGGIDYPMLMAGGCIASLIPLFLSLFFQRYIVMGLTSGGEK